MYEESYAENRVKFHGKRINSPVHQQPAVIRHSSAAMKVEDAQLEIPCCLSGTSSSKEPASHN
ncbi:hypothetical protein [Pseudomonas syringae pv. coryli]|uniref:hypothetical protein n=1 Tax=Pseudomonas syringae pv. coryli TaxID=317659 RepID=UPI003D2D3727